MKRIFDAHGGIVSTVEHDDLTDTTTFATMQTPQSIDGVLDHNRKMRQLGRPVSKGGLGLRPMASIPQGLALQWIKEAGFPSYHAFRTTLSTVEQNEFFRRRYMNKDFEKVRTSEWQ